MYGDKQKSIHLELISTPEDNDSSQHWLYFSLRKIIFFVLNCLNQRISENKGYTNWKVVSS
jgi:hypothetical protein